MHVSPLNGAQSCKAFQTPSECKAERPLNEHSRFTTLFHALKQHMRHFSEYNTVVEALQMYVSVACFFETCVVDRA